MCHVVLTRKHSYYYFIRRSFCGWSAFILGVDSTRGKGVG